MRIVCESCGHTGEASDVRVEGTRVVVTCAQCGASATLGGTGTPAAGPAESAGARSSAEAPPVAPGSTPAEATEATPAVADAGPALPPVKCPKCGHRQHDPKACHKCGLVFARAAGGARPWEQVPPDKADAIRVATELWAAVEAAPADPRRHDDFTQHCRTNGIPEWAAMRYRHWLADHPTDELSRGYQVRAIADAQAVAQALAQGDAEKFALATRRVRTILVAIVLAMVLLATLVMVRVFTARPSLPF